MDSRRRAVLQDLQTDDRLEVEPLLEFFRARPCRPLPIYAIEEIESQRTVRQRSALLSALAMRGDAAFVHLFDALKATGQDVVADTKLRHLLPSEASVTRTVNFDASEENEQNTPPTESAGRVRRPSRRCEPKRPSENPTVECRPLHQSTVAGNRAISSGTEPAPGEEMKLQLEDAEAYDDFEITVDGRSSKDVYAEWLAMSKEIYPNFTSPKGLALIINNMHFISHNRRDGTEKDEENLTRLFAKLGYVVDTAHDLKSFEIHDAIRKFGADERHSKYHSAIVAILSHGEHDVIFGRDSNPIDVNTLVRQMNAINSPLLAGKPKIFLIQACRGDLYDRGYTTTDGSSPTKKRSGGFWSSLTRAVGISIPSTEESSSASRAASSSSSSSSGPAPFQPPERRVTRGQLQRSAEGDICIFASAPPNYCSFRNNIRGSWFVQSVCEVFAKHAHDSDLDELMRLVRKRMDDNFSTSPQQRTAHVNGAASSIVYKQIPETVTRFSRRFFFYPGVTVRECDGVVLRQQEDRQEPMEE